MTSINLDFAHKPWLKWKLCDHLYYILNLLTLSGTTKQKSSYMAKCRQKFTIFCDHLEATHGLRKF